MCKLNFLTKNPFCGSPAVGKSDEHFPTVKIIRQWSDGIYMKLWWNYKTVLRINNFVKYFSTQLQTGGPRFEAHLAKQWHVRFWHLVHIKSIVGAMSSKSIQIIPLGVTKWGSHTVGNSPLRSSAPTLNPTNPTQPLLWDFKTFIVQIKKKRKKENW